MTQDTAAAERSAHVVREAKVCKVAPCVEIAPGVWKLRAVVELEAERDAAMAEAAQLRQALAGLLTTALHYGGLRDSDIEAIKAARAALGMPDA
jgi:hypothetical protein